jgi:F-type H+-transporting ATPase subunit epsilon
MMALTTHLDIVSAEAEIFSGLVQRLSLTGALGEMGIYPGHAPLLTHIQPGFVRLLLQDGKEAVYYVSGGVLEVVPKCVTVLADTAERAEDLDESKVLAAQKSSEALLAGAKGDFDYSKALAELANVSGQMRAIKELKKLRKH